MSRLGCGALVLVSLAAALAACEGGADSYDAPSFEAPDGGFDADLGASQEDDGGTMETDAATAADAAGAARAAELVKMHAHLDSLYAPNDVSHHFTTSLGDKVDCLPFQRSSWARLGAMVHLVEADGCYSAGVLEPAAYGQYSSQYGASMFYFGGTGQSATCP